MVITFDSSNMAVNAYEMLKNQTHEEKKLLCNNYHPHTHHHPFDAVSDDNVNADAYGMLNNQRLHPLVMLMLMLKHRH